MAETFVNGHFVSFNKLVILESREASTDTSQNQSFAAVSFGWIFESLCAASYAVPTLTPSSVAIFGQEGNFSEVTNGQVGLVRFPDLSSTGMRVFCLILLPTLKVQTLKRAALLVLLIPLTLFEVYLCTAFLPDSWQHAIDDHIPNIFPKSNDWTPITHPLLSQEIEGVLREHIGLRIALYTITVALLIGNALLIRWVWRLSRRTRASSPEIR